MEGGIAAHSEGVRVVGRHYNQRIGDVRHLHCLLHRLRQRHRVSQRAVGVAVMVGVVNAAPWRRDFSLYQTCHIFFIFLSGFFTSNPV